MVPQLSSFLWQLLHVQLGCCFGQLKSLWGVLHSERVSQIMANGLLELFPPNRLATTFPEFHNLKGIPQEKSYLLLHQ